MKPRLIALAMLGSLVGLYLAIATPIAVQAQPVAAPDVVTFQVSGGLRDGWHNVDATINGAYAGQGWWSADPGGDINGDGRADPGDALSATDEVADGWGVEAHLSTGRVASTRGHSSPYWSPWVTGNLPEDTYYLMWVCVVRGSAQQCSASVEVFS